MNSTIETILNHRSIRNFTNEKLTSNQIHTIVTAAQQASTSSYVMAYSIIGITDKTIKDEFKKISGHPHAKENGHLFVFCADLHRVYDRASRDEQKLMEESLESTEQFLVATIDATLAAQNAVIAAESMGLGICFLGGIRNNIKRVNDLLKLPDYCIPLYGLSVGYPASMPEQKPRLPFDAVYHENHYDVEKQHQILDKFDEKLASYYQTRAENARSDTWTDQMFRKYSNPVRLDVTGFIKDKGLNKR